MTLYDRLSAAGCELDSHESDLYVRATPEASAIINAALAANEMRGRPTVFRSEVDGRNWYDCPFMFAPWWRARGFS